MRRLIGFFVVTSLRVMLLFAVVAWVSTRWWGVLLAGSEFGVGFQALNVHKGYAIAFQKTGALLWRMEVHEPAVANECLWVFQPHPDDIDVRNMSLVRSVPGFTWLSDSGRAIIAIEHWLIVSVLLIGYVLAELSYRKRRLAKHVQPADSTDVAPGLTGI